MRSRPALFVLGLCLAANASAFVTSGYSWMWLPDPVSEPWELNAASFPAAAGTVQEVEDAFVGAMDAWGNAGNPYFSWTYGGQTSDLSYTYDGRMIAQWHASTPAVSTLAETLITFFGDEVYECDMRFYGANGGGSVSWSADPLGAPAGSFDLEKIAVHELGHCLGLGHSGNGSAIMFASTGDGTGPADRALHIDDINGLNALYTEFVPSPDLVLVSTSTTDLGDGDGYFEAGEVIGITFEVDNLMDAEAINALATVSGVDADLLVQVTEGAPTDADHPGLSTRDYVGAELRVSDDCTEMESTSTYEVAFSADNYTTNLYYIIDIDLTCLGPDLDGDGVPESLDLCEGFNDNADRDGDGVPNRCDPCPDDNPDDSDGDGICDEDDACAGFDDARDLDGDGIPDDCQEEPAVEAPTDEGETPGGCACTSAGSTASWIGWLLAVFVWRKRTRPAVRTTN